MLKLFYFISFVAIFFVSCSGGVGVKQGNQAPDFTLKDVAEKKIKLSDLKGKVVMIHFWTDYCVSCKAEFPQIVAYYNQLKGKDFELLAVNLGQNASVSKEFQKEFGADFPMLIDDKAVLKDIYQIQAFPTNFFINPEGKIIRIIKGWTDQKQVNVIIKQNKKM